MLAPRSAAVAEGTVWHSRRVPRHHSFTRRVSYVWVDPDDVGGLVDHHPLWRMGRGVVSFRRADFGGNPAMSLATSVRSDLSGPLGRRPSGPVRMLTQLRRLGWLFNPITVFFVWDGPGPPVAAVLEVTNTPWKERLRYPLILVGSEGWVEGSTDKALHVSPFLGMEYRYRFRATDRNGRITVRVDVLDANGSATVSTRLDVQLEPASRRVLSRSLWRHLGSTLAVSVGIHLHALRLWSKGVPFIAHPRKRIRGEGVPA